MNKKGFIDLDFDAESLIPIGLALIGAMAAWFTLSGGFAPAVTGEQFSPIGGIWMKLIGALGGAVIGYIWGTVMTR